MTRHGNNLKGKINNLLSPGKSCIAATEVYPFSAVCVDHSSVWRPGTQGPGTMTLSLVTSFLETLLFFLSHESPETQAISTNQRPDPDDTDQSETSAPHSRHRTQASYQTSDIVPSTRDNLRPALVTHSLSRIMSYTED